MILLRYLMLETFKSQVGILFVLLLIFVSQKFIGILAQAINGVIPADLVLTLLYLNLPTLGTLMWVNLNTAESTINRRESRHL